MTRRTIVCTGWAALVLSLSSGCSDECTFDTDCPLFNRCAGGQCLPLGVARGQDAGQLPDAGPVDSSLPDTGAVIPLARIAAEQTTLGGGMWSLSATFGLASTCAVTPMPPCEVTDCTLSGAPARAAMAGLISLLGGAAAPVLVAGADGTYPPATGVGTLWDATPGLPAPPELRIQAQGFPAGQNLGPFSLDIDGSFLIDVTSPDFSGAVTLSRSAPNDFQWATDAGDGLLVVILTASEDLTPPQRREVLVECSFRGSSGTAPPAAIATLPGSTASYRIVHRRTAVRMVSDWTVVGLVETTATQAGGAAPAQGTVTLN